MDASMPLWAGKITNHRRIFGVARSTELRFEDEHSIEEALLIWKESSADFADCLIGARHRVLGCRTTASFDAKAIKLPGFIAA